MRKFQTAVDQPTADQQQCFGRQAASLVNSGIK